MTINKMTTADPETHSEDLVSGNIEQLRTLFPEAFVEGKIDFDVLHQLLGGQWKNEKKNMVSIGLASARLASLPLRQAMGRYFLAGRQCRVGYHAEYHD